MIGWLQGIIQDQSSVGKIVLNVNGVGYDVELSLMTFFQLEQQQSLQIALHIHTVVREDALILYGFLQKQERAVFRTLIKVNGIGPRVAMNILSHATPHEFIHNVLNQNKEFLIKLPGIGRKTAERLLIELKDAFESGFHDSDPMTLKSAGQKAASIADEAVMALVALGYKQQDAQQVVKKLDDGQVSVETLLRSALRRLTVTA